jgi:hypothetical protein
MCRNLVWGKGALYETHILPWQSQSISSHLIVAQRSQLVAPNLQDSLLGNQALLLLQGGDNGIV